MFWSCPCTRCSFLRLNLSNNKKKSLDVWFLASFFLFFSILKINNFFWLGFGQLAGILLDTKNLDLASKRDIDMATTLLVGSGSLGRNGFYKQCTINQTAIHKNLHCWFNLWQRIQSSKCVSFNLVLRVFLCNKSHRYNIFLSWVERCLVICGCCWLMEAKFFDLFLIFFCAVREVESEEKVSKLVTDLYGDASQLSSKSFGLMNPFLWGLGF